MHGSENHYCPHCKATTDHKAIQDPSGKLASFRCSLCHHELRVNVEVRPRARNPIEPDRNR